MKSRDTEELEEQGREDYKTDQELKKPQPPLVKAPMGGAVTQLPRILSLWPCKTTFWPW